MPSVGYWNRLEAQRSTTDTIGPQQARIRDPLWMLLRQWQLGEFKGADSGSPAYASYSIGTAPVTGWRVAGGSTFTPLVAAPLESQVEAEPLTADVATRVELGQVAERLLRANGAGDVIAAFRSAYPIDVVAADPTDPAEVAFRRVCGGRAIDGVALVAAARAAAPGLPTSPTIPANLKAGVTTALTAFVQSVAATFGELGNTDPAGWQPARLSYGAEVSIGGPVLSAIPDSDGEFGWDSFDVKSGLEKVAWKVQPQRSIVPAHIRFRGMANARFWDFEPSTTDFGALSVNRADMGRLAVMDIMLVHGNDWFMIPLDLSVGTLCEVRSLVVRDVFGVDTVIPRADAGGGGPTGWTMFAPSQATKAGAPAPCLFVPPTAGPATMFGPVLEDVNFARDEMANMVWAIERETQNGIGQPWTGHEREMAHNRVPPAPPPTPDPAVPLRYQIEGSVPEYWIPFLPVSIDPVAGTVALEEGAMVRPGTHPVIVAPAGRILNPSTLAGAAYRIPEEEIARTGVRIQRAICRTRWTDGSTYLWGVRWRGPGTGDANSALQYDAALPNAQAGS